MLTRGCEQAGPGDTASQGAGCEGAGCLCRCRRPAAAAVTQDSCVRHKRQAAVRRQGKRSQLMLPSVQQTH